MPASDATPLALLDLSNTEHRARWAQTAIDAGLPLVDEVLMRHVNDCCELMQAAHERFRADGKPEDAALRRQWEQRRTAALAKLSPEFKAAWFARIDGEVGAAYFIDQGDAARARLASNDEKGRT